MSDLLPSQGLCHAVFLLNRAAHLGAARTKEAWVAIARRQPTFMAHALNLDFVATRLTEARLANFEASVVFDASLEPYWQCADRQTLIGIARALLERSPPFWVSIVLSSGDIRLEYIPSQDLNALAWMGGDLVSVLASLSNERVSRIEAEFKKRIGDAAEGLVLADRKKRGGQVIHVSKIGDYFGYDIEHRLESRIRRLEVKGSVERTSDRFFITRNEVTQAARFPDEWALIQVIFRSNVAINATASIDDVAEVRSLSANCLIALVPLDTASFRWVDAAEIRVPSDVWSSYSFN